MYALHRMGLGGVGVVRVRTTVICCMANALACDWGRIMVSIMGEKVTSARFPDNRAFILTIYYSTLTTLVVLLCTSTPSTPTTAYECAESCRLCTTAQQCISMSSLRSTGTVSAWDFGTTTRGSRVRGSRRSTRHSGRRWPRRRRSVGSPATWQAGTRP